MLKGMDVNFLFIHLLLIFLLIIHKTNGAACTVEDLPGSYHSNISPNSSAILLENSTVEVFCSINDSRYTVDKLSISEGRQLLNTTIINSTTILYKLENAPNMNSIYLCKYGNCGAQSVGVFVGLPPQDVLDFKCRSTNWQNLNCSFHLIENEIRTDVYLEYYVLIAGGAQQVNKSITKNFNKGGNCSLTPTYRKGYYCIIEPGVYRQAYENYVFKLRSTNELGKHMQTFTINNFASMIPDKVVSINYTNLTSNSVVLKWEISHFLTHWTEGFVFDIKIELPKNSNCQLKSTKVDLSKLEQKGVNFTLPVDLEFAFLWYEITIRFRSAKAPDIEEMWSAGQAIVIMSLSRIPDSPPIVDIGSFDYKDNKDLVIYWKELSVCHQNGNSSTYQLSKPVKNKTNLSAKYEHVNLNKKFEVSIKSANSNGTSFDETKIIVPDRNSLVRKPRNLKKFLNENIYKLTWDKPENQDDLKDYTIFWCFAKDQQADECDSSFDFIHVDKSIQEFNHTAKDKRPITFAISANTENSSSGMLWAMCTASENKDINTVLNDIWIENVSSTTMNIKWKLGCTDETIVKGFSISYCAIKEPLLDCHEPAVIVNSTDKRGYNLQNLRPYTLYRFNISMYSHNKMGAPSHPKENATSEGIPTSPTNLTYLYVNSTEIKLKWNEPEYWNGKKQFYEITYNDYAPVTTNFDDTEPTSYLLQHLNGSTEYNISIKACAQHNCSNSSNIITVMTDIGIPNKISEVRLSGTISKPLINWDKPTIPNGEVSYYEFRLNIDENKEIITKISKLNTNWCTLVAPICNPERRGYDVSVRAVNVKSHGNTKFYNAPLNGGICDDEYKLSEYLEETSTFEHLKGKWSKIESRPCENNVYGNFYVNVAIICCGFLIILYLIFIGLKKFRKMKDIGIELPAGIEDIIKDSKPKISDNNLNKMDKKDDDFTSEQEKKKLIQSVHNSQLSLENNSQCGSSDFCEPDEIEEDKLKDNDQQQDQHQQDEEEHNNDPIDNLQNFHKKDQLKPFMVDNGVPTAVHLMKPPPQTNIFPPKFQVMSNGYVQASAFSPPNANGYVQQQPLPRIVNSGYTPISALTPHNKNIIDSPHPTNINVKTSVTAPSTDHVISGYVTHKQLSDFGHRMQ